MNTLAAMIAINSSGRHACSRQRKIAPLVHDVQSVRCCRGDSLLRFNTRVGSGSFPRVSAPDCAENSAPDVKAPIGTASVAGYCLSSCATARNILPQAQCSSGLKQSRPFPARSVKVRKVRANSTTSRRGAREIGNNEVPTASMEAGRFTLGLPVKTALHNAGGTIAAQTRVRPVKSTGSPSNFTIT